VNQEGACAGVARAQDWAGVLCRSFSVARVTKQRGRNFCRNALTADNQQICLSHCASNTFSYQSDAKARKSQRWTSGVSSTLS
jgi:hypothetical protein